jgi:phosphopantetheinyl transferase (holo-ACP synthase)
VIGGIGVDIADISRRQAAIRRARSLAARLFAEGERSAKPGLLASGADAAAGLVVRTWRLSPSHDGRLSVATVVAHG